MVRVSTLVGAVVLGSAPSPELTAPVVAVFSIHDARDQGRLPAQALSELTSYLSVRFAEGGLYRLTPPAQVREALTEKKAESFKACFDEACQIELGKAVAAEKSLGTKILRIDSRSCAVATALYDLKTEVTERAATAEGGCDRDAIARLLRAAVAKLRGESPGRTGTAAVVTPAPPPASPSQVGASAAPSPPATNQKPCRRAEIQHPRALGASIRSDPRVRKRYIIKELRNGTRVTVLSKRGRWIKVRVDETGLTGYVIRARLSFRSMIELSAARANALRGTTTVSRRSSSGDHPFITDRR